MKRKLIQAIQEIRKVLRIARERKIDFMASGLTYYEFFSLVPMALLLFLVVSFLGDRTLAMDLLFRFTGVLPEVGGEAIRNALKSYAGQSSVIGLLVLVWASIQLFRSFEIAFTQIYPESGEETLMRELESAVVALVVIATTILLTLSAGAFLSTYPGIPSASIIWTSFTFLGLTMIFVPLYYVFPHLDAGLRDLLPGSVVAAAGWTFLQSGFGLYTGTFAGSVFGVFGGVLLLVLWMYVGNILILFGAVVNLVYWRERK